jgi:hypothetical protein
METSGRFTRLFQGFREGFCLQLVREQIQLVQVDARFDVKASSCVWGSARS